MSKDLKVICTESRGNIFTVGRVYERINGILTTDDGTRITTHVKSDDTEEWTILSKFKLYEEDKNMENKKYMKVKCVKSILKYFTEGKIYEWINGAIKDDYEYIKSKDLEGSNPSEWNFAGVLFEELKEPEEKSQPKYKIGDRIIVRKDLKEGDLFGKYRFALSMTNFIGKTVIIREINSDFSYKIKGSDWHWAEEMFEGFAPERHNGKVVCIKADNANTNFRKGRIYQVLNGCITSLSENGITNVFNVADIDDLNAKCKDKCEFIELIED